MKKLSILLAIFMVVAINFSALAQDEEIERDVLEVNIYGGLGIPTGGISNWNDSLGAKTGFAYGAEIGYFLKPNMIAGFNFSYIQFGVDAPNEASELNHRLYNPSLYLKYYFEGESNLVPYLKAHVGVDNPKFTTFVGTSFGSTAGNRYREESYNPVFAYGFGGGLFYYTADYSGLFFEFNYHRGASKSAEASYGGSTFLFGSDIANFDLRLGIRMLISTD